jgi:hypothetical protein
MITQTIFIKNAENAEQQYCSVVAISAIGVLTKVVDTPSGVRQPIELHSIGVGRGGYARKLLQINSGVQANNKQFGLLRCPLEA